MLSVFLTETTTQAISGAFIGYLYGSLVQVSRAKIALAFATWHVVETIFVNFAQTLTQYDRKSSLLVASTLALSGTAGLYILNRVSLIESKFTFVLSIFYSISVVSYLLKGIGYGPQKLIN